MTILDVRGGPVKIALLVVFGTGILLGNFILN